MVPWTWPSAVSVSPLGKAQAIEQVNRYAETETVKSSVKTTTLHKIVVVFHGTEMAVCEEII